MAQTEAELALWNRIQNFSLDDVTASFSFTQRLARDNQWGLAFADRVVTEYKKFMFLATCCNHVVTPSEQIDQAWHLHLIYTRSYWEEFCGEILEHPIHHGPTKGGKKEHGKFVDLYEQTIQSYREKFGEEPPQDIWPPSAERFDKTNRRSWVSSKDFWLIRKPKFSKLFNGVSLPIATAAAAPLAVLAWSPYDLGGKAFLLFYALLGIASLFFAYVLQRVLVSDGSEKWETVSKKSTLPINHLAYLAGGESQVLKSALFELLAGGYAKSFRQQLQLAANAPTNPKVSKLAKAIYQKLKLDSSIDQKEISAIAKLPLAKISGDLVRAGLLESRIKRHVIGWATGIVAASILGIGVGRLIQAAGTGRPVGYLVLEMLAIAVVGTILVYSVPFRTKTGDEVLANEKSRVDNGSDKKPDLKANANEVALLVGLFGTSVLSGTIWSSFHKELNHVLSPTISTSGGGSTSSGCGGSGCGGGGCGGCGGCGG